MHRVLLPFILLLLVLGVRAAAPTPVDLHVTAHDDGGQFWFEVDGHPGRNPDLHLQPGTTVVVAFENQGTVAHNFCFDAPVSRCNVPYPDGIPVGGSDTSSFDIPAGTASLGYYCLPHEGLGMKGVAFGDSATKQKPSPAIFGIVSVAAMIVLAARRR
jgi:plastocyanin